MIEGFDMDMETTRIIEEEILSEAEEEYILALLNDLKNQEVITHDELKRLFDLK